MMKYIIINIITAIISTLVIIYFINLHSVHPVHGNYQQVNAQTTKCYPWDDCR